MMSNHGTTTEAAENLGRTPRAAAIARLSAAAAVLLLLTSCASIEPPTVTLTGVDVEGVSMDGVELTLLVDVTNPNVFGASVGKLNYEIFVDDTELANGNQLDSVMIEAGKTVEVGIPFTLTWTGMKESLKEITDGNEHEWKIKGYATLSKGVVSKTFTFDESGSFTGPSDIDIDLNFSD